MSDFANRLRNAEDYGNGHLEKLHIAAAEEIDRLTTALSEAEQRVKDARREAVEDALSALTAHKLYQYRPKAFQGFIDYARSALKSEERQ